MIRPLASLCLAATPGWPAVGDEGAREQAIRQELTIALPGLTIGAVLPTQVVGVYAVETDNGKTRKTLHAVDGGSHVIAGDLYALAKGGPVNLTEVRRERRRRDLLAALDPAAAIVFPAVGERQAVLHVFTDVDCPHCRAFHADVPALNGLGIEVRYLAFARAGPGSPTWERMASAWCAEDRHEALTALKRGDAIPAASCDDPLTTQHELARAIGAEGTPTLVSGAGGMIRGHVPPADLAARLGIKPPAGSP